MTARMRRARGFTLFELMVVLLIVGLLSSIAIPEFQRSSLRTRAAERATIMRAMRLGIEDAFGRNLIPVPPGLSGVPNPAGTPGTTKRPFQPALPGWRDVNMVIQGNCYYTYEFSASDPADPAVAPTYWISGAGDLDGDGDVNTKLYVMELRANSGWAVTAETPGPGRETDVGSF